MKARYVAISGSDRDASVARLKAIRLNIPFAFSTPAGFNTVSGLVPALVSIRIGSQPIS